VDKDLVYVGMSGDVIHPGHINILKIAESYGEVIVGLLTDKAISSYKKVPLMSYEERYIVLSGIKHISKIIKQETLDYTSNLTKLKPKYVVHGDDWKSGIQKETREKVVKTLEKWGGELIEVPYTEGISSASLKDKLAKKITTDERRASLRSKINKKDTLRFLDIHNALSSLIIENTGIVKDGKEIEFDGMWASSLTDSTAKGKPDIEAVDTSSRINTLNDVMEVTTKPIIYDGDTGGKVEHFRYTVQNLERIGVSAVVIEDKKGLKRNSLFGTDVPQEQEEVEIFSEKIKMGNLSKKTDEFMIIARIESLILNKGLKDALHRAEKYCEAGANGILIHSKEENPADIINFAKSFKNNYDIPLVVVPTTYNQIKVEELSSLGIDIVIFANHLLRSAYPAMLNTAKQILKNGRSHEIEKDLMSVKDIISFIPYQD
tara:strand:+ start:198 stop:1496 length:1299 start_codon:yes stop_codon:yes gene_type:complete